MVLPPLTSEEETKRDELILDLIKRRYDSELDRIKSLDNKAGSLIGFVSVVIGLLVGVGTFTILDKLSKTEFSILYFVGIGLLLLSIGLSLGAIKIRRFEFAPNVVNLKNHYFNDRYRSVIRANAGTMAEKVTHMEKTNNDKGELINWSWYFLLAGLGLVLVFVVIFSAIGTLTTPTNVNATGKIVGTGSLDSVGNLKFTAKVNIPGNEK